MVVCRGCEATVNTWFGDAWCDDCGGVMSRPDVLLMRHVATAETEGGEVRIVHDISGDKYKFRCNRMNPRYVEFLKNGGRLTREQKRVDDFIPTPILTQWDKTLVGLVPLLEKEFGEASCFQFTEMSTEDEMKALGA